MLDLPIGRTVTVLAIDDASVNVSVVSDDFIDVSVISDEVDVVVANDDDDVVVVIVVVVVVTVVSIVNVDVNVISVVVGVFSDASDVRVVKCIIRPRATATNATIVIVMKIMIHR